MQPDVIISVRFFTPSEGGRTKAVEGPFYACPLFVNGEGFDCRLMLEGKRLELGSTYEVPLKFLSPELALPKMSIGKEILLWEGRNIAAGKIAKIISEI